MMTLGGVALPESLQWPDQFSESNVQQTTKRTLGGGLVVFSEQITAGRNITLEATQKQGWLTKTMVDAIRSLSNSAGSVYTLTTPNGNYSVMFRHNEPPAFESTPLLSKQVFNADDFFVGVIKLITV